MNDNRDVINLFHEIGMLANIPRSGFAFLGSGQQSVAEHSFRVTFIAYILGQMINEPIDQNKLLMMCLIHDLPESRTGDLNYVQKKYVKTNLNKVLEDIKMESSFGHDIASWIEEYEKGESLEAQLAHDADQLELLLVLKREQDLGHVRAKDWFENACKRLQTLVAKQLSQNILQISSDEWWLKDKLDPHWIDGGKSKSTKTSSLE